MQYGAHRAIEFLALWKELLFTRRVEPRQGSPAAPRAYSAGSRLRTDRRVRGSPPVCFTIDAAVTGLMLPNHWRSAPRHGFRRMPMDGTLQTTREGQAAATGSQAANSFIATVY